VPSNQSAARADAAIESARLRHSLVTGIGLAGICMYIRRDAILIGQNDTEYYLGVNISSYKNQIL
jgi:hypothetical protein